MYTAIRTYRTTDSAELARRVESEFLPIVRDVPGFVGYYVVDAGDGAIASITVCADKSGMDESTARAAEWVRDRISELIESGPEILAGDVTVSLTAAGVAM
jgi:hypothetical protein